jgi:hypothetical protein
MKLLLDDYLEKRAADNANNPLWWQQEAKPKPKPLPEPDDRNFTPSVCQKLFGVEKRTNPFAPRQ